jgi:hypothetical protein
MREIQFPVEFKGSGARNLIVSIKTGPTFDAPGFIDREFITEPLMTFLKLLSKWKNIEGGCSVSAPEEHVLRFDISAGLVSEPWQVASIIGLIDVAIWIQDMDDNPFITSVTFDASHMPGLTVESGFEDMDRYAAACAGELSTYLGDGFEIEGVKQSVWPADAEQYFFDIDFALAVPLDARQVTEAKKLFDQMETSLAGTAFESKNSMEYLLDEGLIPFPSKVEFADKEILYKIETPPSDISIPLIIMRDTLKQRVGAQISDWKVLIRERW